MPWDRVFDAVAQNGPLAVVMGAVVVVLWKRLVQLRTHYEGDPSDPERKPGVLSLERRAAQQREDAVRGHYEGLLAQERAAHQAEIDRERGEQRALLDQLLNALKRVE